MNQRTSRSRILALALGGIALVSAGCGGGDDGAEAGGDSGAATNTVAMKLIAFKPERLSVPAGTAVTWKNEDASEHTVTSGEVKQGTGGVSTAADSKFESGSLKQNATFAFTFKTPGTYAYFCKIHPATMRGEITVT